MYTDERRKIYKEAIDAWGFRAQARMLQEECGELIVAVSHCLREREDGVKEMAEELADVYIMVGQMIEYLGADIIKHVVDSKLKMVEEKLDKVNNDENLLG